MTLTFSTEETNPLISALIQERFGPSAVVNRNIDSHDQMYAACEAVHHDREPSLSAYFMTGMQIADTIRQIVEWKFDGLGNVSAILDFASGWGRSTRFLVQEIPPQRIWVSDILADAVRFQQDQFEVNGIVSTTNPEDFQCDKQFDCIVVSSLFSHLPEKTFMRWLHKLHSLLNPGGMLIFSVHDEALLSPGAMPESGIYYVERSEIDILDVRDYGSTYVTEAFVRQAIGEATGKKVYYRIQKALAHLQDVYVIVNSPDQDFAGLRFAYGPQGHIDRCVLTNANGLSIEGWATDITPGDVSVIDIQVIINGHLRQRCMPFINRPDVAKHLAGEEHEKFVYSGWACSCHVPVPISPSSDILLIRAISSNQTRFVLYVSTVEKALVQ
ncbi:MAG: class I SAM-dependent methyltransferase [Thermomicrobiales bacterium]